MSTSSAPFARARDAANPNARSLLRGKRTAAGVIKSKGRGAAAVPQRLILVSGSVPKEERQLRAAEAGSARPERLFGPASKDDRDMSANKGRLGICYLGNGSTFRPGLGNMNHVRVVMSQNGLLRDGMYAYGVPAVIQNERDTDDPLSEPMVTCAISGVQTIVNTGSQVIQAGDALQYDPEPFTTTDADGNVISAVQIAGVSAGTLHPQVRPIRPNTKHVRSVTLDRRMNAHMGRVTDWGAVLRDPINPAHRLVLMAREKAKEVNTEMQEASASPERDRVTLHALWEFTQLAQIPGRIVGLNAADRTMAHRVGLTAVREFLLGMRDTACKLRQDFQDSVPMTMGAAPRSSFTAATRSADDIESQHLADLLDPAKMARKSGEKLYEELNEARARITLVVAHEFAVLESMQRAYNQRFNLGLALSGAQKAAPLDLLIM